MKLKVYIHKAEEGGYWAEVPSITGCSTQGDIFEELLQKISMKQLKDAWVLILILLIMRTHRFLKLLYENDLRK